jgi:hypothetical protein
MDHDVDGGDDADIIFSARTDDGRRIQSILASICLSTDRKRDSSATLAWCEVTDQGMTLTVNVAKSVQAVAYVKSERVFHTWWLANAYRGDNPEERLQFGINLGMRTSCRTL